VLPSTHAGHEREKEGHARHGRSALTTCDAMGAVLVYVVMRQKHRPHARLLGSAISPGFVSKLNTSLFLVPARHSHRLVEFTHQFTVEKASRCVGVSVQCACVLITPMGARVDMKWVITSAHDHVTFGKKERVVHLDAWPPHCVLDGREKQWQRGQVCRLVPLARRETNCLSSGTPTLDHVVQKSVKLWLSQKPRS